MVVLLVFTLLWDSILKWVFMQFAFLTSFYLALSLFEKHFGQLMFLLYLTRLIENEQSERHRLALSSHMY